MKIFFGLEHGEEGFFILSKHTASIKQNLEVQNGLSEQRTKSVVLRKEQETTRMKEIWRNRSMALSFAIGSLD